MDKVLCISSSYEKKFYLAEDFRELPSQIKDELQIMCVLYTEDVGGILALMFDEEGNLTLNVTSEENDFSFDEIGSELKIREIQRKKVDLLTSLEKYYRVKFLGEEL
ncbi:MAG: DUF6145 family protein [Lachnospiraceae bacterium]|nr:DUF6145 family protein [Lachnospiraceae bacterium]